MERYTILKKIKSTLKKRGYIFKTKKDTEIILASCAEWGPSCVNKYNGMWAFAIYDCKKIPSKI